MLWLPGWSHRYPLTLDNTNSPIAATVFQSNVVLTTGNFDFTKALASGADLRVTASDGVTLLPFFLASYDGSANGSLWVNQALSASAATSIFLYCGNSGATSVSSYDNTFGKLATDASTLCLVHFDDGSGSSPVDATGTYLPSIVSGPPTWAAHDGGGWGSAANQFVSGSYITFNGTSQYCSITGLLDTWPAAGCIAMWWQSPATIANNPRVFSKYNTAPGNPEGGMDLAVQTSTGSTTVGALWFLKDANQNFSSSVYAGGHTIIATSTWYHVAVTWTGGLFTVYLDGVKELTFCDGLYLPASGSTNPFFIGGYPGALGLSASSFDEFAVLNRCPLPEEIHAWYLRRSYMKGMEESGRWATNARSDAIVPSGTGWEQNLTIEPSVIVDSAVGTPGYRMSYTGIKTGTSNQIGIATSTDGVTWTQYASNPVLGAGVGGESSNANGSWLVKSGSTYYLYYVDGYSGASLKVATSTDGVTYGGNTVLVAPLAQAWIKNSVSNMTGVYDSVNARWIFAFSNYDLSGGDGKTGFATGTALGGAWTLWSGNPATSLEYVSGLYAPRSLNFDASGNLHIWCHCSYNNTTLVPTEVYHAVLSAANVNASNFNSWVKVTNDPVFPLMGETFSGGAADQTADFVVLDLSTQVNGYYDYDRNVAGVGQQGNVGQVVFPGTLTNLLTNRPAVSLGAIQSSSSFVPPWAMSNLSIGMGLF